MKTLFSVDKETGRKVWLGEDPDGTSWVKEEQDIQPAIDYCSRMYNATNHKSYKNDLRKKNLWHVMSVPNIVIEKLMREKGINMLSPDKDEFERAVKELKGPEYSKFRLTPGKW